MTADELSYDDVIVCIAVGAPCVKVYEKDGLHSFNPEYAVICIYHHDNMRLIGQPAGLVTESDFATKEKTSELLEAFVDKLKKGTQFQIEAA